MVSPKDGILVVLLDLNLAYWFTLGIQVRNEGFSEPKIYIKKFTIPKLYSTIIYGVKIASHILNVKFICKMNCKKKKEYCRKS